MADHIRGFPVTAEQIRKHLKIECHCCIAGNLTRRKVSNKNFCLLEDVVVETHHDDDKSKQPLSKKEPHGLVPPLTRGDFSAVPMEKIDPRRLKPGAYVSLDDVGPYYGAYMASFCDFATGYGFEKPMGKLGRAAGPDCARAADAHFKSVRSPIGVLCSDSLSVYDSKAMEKVAEDCGFKQRLTPPNQKEYNHAESHVKVIKNRAISKQTCAPHVSEYLSLGLWKNSSKCNNLRKS
jgi:hypothetical protein